MHLASMYKMVRKFKPQSVVLDPITNLVACGVSYRSERYAFAPYRFYAIRGITLMLTALNSGSTEHIDENVSSLVDTWILVRDLESDGERNRAIYIMKSRGMEHSNAVGNFSSLQRDWILLKFIEAPVECWWVLHARRK
jgi:circadian clock protein KaiC